ncbi:hypothetical protein [Spiroplasma endosymbiont of Danaus chrysippus]|uniref:hypothetical protein n=1 Tax=Spiroplasma endosymbiont of Danaus chrysippus TaxID=2691041 RepID=UPI00157B53DC|nr:hypothetical protein [Spiroplasma endosymbiont of Danaus chrysippus]
MKCNYCHKKPSIVIKTKHEKVIFDMYLCNIHSQREIVYLKSKLQSKAGIK